MGTGNSALIVTSQIIGWLAAFSLSFTVRAFNEEDASEQWLSAFTWVQTGRNLSQSGQTPLALGSFIEALRQLEVVASNYPGYETKIVNYRIDALRNDIEKLKADLSAEDLVIANEYITFIGLIERAEQERYTARREKALATLRQAKSDLEAIVSRRPDAFGPAVKNQKLRLTRSIEWLVTLVDADRTTPLVMPGRITGYLIKGTTEFIRESDLPSTPGLAISGNSLFPEM
jgi:hypothetical protein